MQLDMHYYGTYAMARAAGLKAEVCKTIATAAQFVDDNAASVHVEFLDGGRIDAQPTAHHLGSLSNIDAEDQRQVWVPFHFLPGNEGETFSERLLCRIDSAIARQMIAHHLTYAKNDFGIYLAGITAHVYADTFSHFGFSGVSSRWNKIVNDSITFDTGLDPDIQDYIEGKARDFYRRYHQEAGFIANMKSWLAETVSGALGHGAVATYPDRPYLSWSFEYEHAGRPREKRDNPATYLSACQALHKMFVSLGRANPDLSQGDGIGFSRIRGAVKGVLAFQGKKEDRIRQWRAAARKGTIGSSRFSIPRYNPEPWLKNAARMNNKEDSQRALQTHIYHFYRAASLHRNYVLRELLPEHGLVVA